MKRIAVVGTTGSGKTTLARGIARTLGVPHVELDALQWGPDWTPAETATFRADVAAALAGESWVVDGNYAAVRDLVWSRADTVVWLDYSAGTVLWRLLVRTLRRGLRQEVLWNGNRERLWFHFTSRDSILLWMLQTHWRRRREYGELLARPEHAHLEAHRLLSPAEAERWLARLARAEAHPPTATD